MRFNKTQIRIFFIGLLLSLAALIIWISFGAEIFTKTEVLIEKQDALTGTTYKIWEDQFKLGLDYTFGFIAATLFISTFLIWRTKTIKDK